MRTVPEISTGKTKESETLCELICNIVCKSEAETGFQMTSIRADFAAADDLLREAIQGRLAGHGSIVIEKSGRIGPSVEIALAGLSYADQYSAVTINSSFA